MHGCMSSQVKQLNEQIDLLKMRESVNQPLDVSATPKGKMQVCV